MVIKWKNGKLKNIKVPRAKSRNPYGHIEVVASKDQKIKPKERKLGRLKASSVLFSPIKDSLKKAKRVLDTKELVKKVRTKKQMECRFIIIDKQKDLPTENAMKGGCHSMKDLEEFILTNGDIIVSGKDIHIEAPTIPLNKYATDLYLKDTGNELAQITGNELAQIYGHCYFIKNWIKF